MSRKVDHMERITFEERKRDAATIMPRAFMLDLSYRDIKEFSKLAKEYGTTPERILQGFICDLIDGTQTHGSDERDLAQQYVDRCSY